MPRKKIRKTIQKAPKEASSQHRQQMEKSTKIKLCQDKTKTKLYTHNEFIQPTKPPQNRGYQIATQQNRKQGAGSVMILHKTAIKVHDSESESILEEIQVAKCRYEDLTIIGVYRSPSVLDKDENDIRKTKEQHA